jgi:hypothetical protein
MYFTAPILKKLTITQYSVDISHTKFYPDRTKTTENSVKRNLHPYVMHAFHHTDFNKTH